MIPLAITLGLGSLIFAFKEKCSVCDSYFTLNEPCLFCGQEVCGDCGSNIGNLGRICTHQHGDLNYALSQRHSVRLISANYRGRVPKPRFNQTIYTSFYKDIDDAQDALKLLTVLCGANTVSQVQRIKEKREDGNYIYTVWAFQGVI